MVMELRKGFYTVLFLLLLLGMGRGTLRAQTLDDYSSIPPFLAAPVTPNVLLLVDNSGSMNNCAYSDKVDTGSGADNCRATTGTDLSDQYLSTTTYYGYFESGRCYSYASSKFSASSSKPCVNSWDGNFLNWLTMRRIDITKWVMTGGQCNSVRSDENSCATLRGHSPANNGACCKVFYKRFDLTGLAGDGLSGVRCIRVENGDFIIRKNGASCGSNSGDDDITRNIRVDAGSKQTGVIQEVGSRARFGLMVFDDDGTNENGGEIRSDVGGNIVTLVNAIEGMQAATWTPLAETVYEAARYFAQISPTPDSGGANFTVNVNNDPYCYSDLNPSGGETGCRNATQGRWVPCCQSYVIVFTDGQPTNDLAIPAGIRDYAHAAVSHSANHHDVCSAYYGGAGSDPCGASGSHYLDDVAFWSHTTDLRPDSGNIAGINETPNTNRLTGVQSLNIYTFFAFGTDSSLLKDAAKAGGFKDKNGNGLPDLTSEWDEDGNSVPDTYFESANAFALRNSLVAVITKILQESASGTSVSVLATSSGGEGAIYQAYFYPRVGVGVDEVYWHGYLQGIFFDFKGQLREDTVPDGRLILNEDKIIETYFDTNLAETRVKRYAVDADGNRTGTPEDISLRELTPIWEGGKRLADRDLSTSPRVIKTWIDKNGDGKVDAPEFIDFSTGNESDLRPYLRAADATEGTNIINYIRGTAVSGYRPREIQSGGSTKTWRLGDIIYSSPVSVGSPQEQFDTKYKDTSYTLFYEKYKNRRHVIYVGANDGMLHAFNGGFFHPGDDPSTGNTSTPKVEHGWFTTNPGDSTSGSPLGEELWAFIPQELLPHLKWLTQTDYNKTRHVYYVDGSPRVADAQIFTQESACTTSLSDSGCKHPGGWGTVLIGSMRMGGGEITATVSGVPKTFRSAYFALDITDPEAAPKLLWVFTDSDLGFTIGWPAIMRLKGASGLAWYAVFGSGPTTYDGKRIKGLPATGNKFGSSITEYGQIYVVNLGTGDLLSKLATDNTDRYAFMGDPVVYDFPKDYLTDIVYLGKSFGSTGDWKGKVYRLRTDGSGDPTTWTLSTLFDPAKPVLAKPTATLDSAGRLWVYFGTGRFFSSGPNSDSDDQDSQALYGIKESSANGCWNKSLLSWKAACPTIAAADLHDVTGASVSTTGVCTGCGATTLQGLINLIDSTTSEKAGWVLNLSGGERVLHESTVLGGIVAATSYKPGTDVCLPQGTNAVYALHYGTGAAYPSADVNDSDGDGDTDEVIGAIGLESNGTTVRRKKELGIGVASKVNVVVGRDPKTGRSTLTGFVQSSTGEIVQIKDIQTPNTITPGTRMFREKSD
jgi:type IV pilus assembly protein PilY1